MESISQMKNFDAADILCIAGHEGCLGAGGFGVVQCAFHPSIGWVAVKCFPVTGGRYTRSFILQEIQNDLSALQQANHENILRVYGWAQWEGSIAMITELMPAGSLRLILDNNNVLLHPVLQLRMCKEISDGTAFIHNFSSTKQLTHGDLKPENILMSNDLHCKVGDFGSARVDKHTGQTTTTSDGSGSKVQVTLVYAAPERLRKMSCRPKKEQDTYSYGMIVHGVLSRETPDQFSPREEFYLDGIKRGERPDTEAIDELEESLTTNKEKEIIQVLRSVMIRCWQDKPTDRPDMRDVRDQLQQLMSKQKQSDVMSSVSQALSKMKIFPPVQSNHGSVALNCFYFDSHTGRFQNDITNQQFLSLQSTKYNRRHSSYEAPTSYTLLDHTNVSISENRRTSSPTVEVNPRNTSLKDAFEPSENCPDDTTNQLASIAEDATIAPKAETLTGTIASKSLSSHATKIGRRHSSYGVPSSYNLLNQTKVSCSTNRRKSAPNVRVNSRKPTLKEVFKSSDLSRLPEEVREAQDLLKEYKSCLTTGMMEEAKTVNNRLVSIIKSNVNTTGDESWVFADGLRFDGRRLESIPFYVASASLHNINCGKEGLRGMRDCVGEMWEVNKELIGDVNLRAVVKNVVIPLMRDIKEEMTKMTSVDEERKCDDVVQALQYIGSSEEKIGELQAAEETHKERVERVQKTFGIKAERREMYGRILERLGDLHKRMSRFDDATSCYKQAIKVYKAAIDFDKEWKKVSIKRCEKKLGALQPSVKDACDIM